GRRIRLQRHPRRRQPRPPLSPPRTYHGVTTLVGSGRNHAPVALRRRLHGDHGRRVRPALEGAGPAPGPPAPQAPGRGRGSQPRPSNQSGKDFLPGDNPRALQDSYEYFLGSPAHRAEMFYTATADPDVVEADTNAAVLTPSGEILSIGMQPSRFVVGNIKVPV